MPHPIGSAFFLATLTIASSPLSLFAQSPWTVVPSGTTANLWSVHFPTSMIGYAVGDSGCILKTTDGGSFWTRQQSNSTAYLFGIYFPTPDTGYAVGATLPPNRGVSLRTTNGGASWSQTIHASAFELIGVYFATGTIGNAVGSQPASPVSLIRKTTDAGITWTNEVLSGTTDNRLYAITNFYAVGEAGASFRSFGTFWQSQHLGGTYSFFGIAKRPSAFYVAVNDGGFVYHNEGSGWSQQIRLTNRRLWAIHFPTTMTCYVVGDSGKVFRSTNGMQSWSFQQAPVTNDLYSVWFTDSLRGVVVGSGGGILRTTSGGTTSVATQDQPPVSFALLQNYPNPFNPSTIIAYDLPQLSHVTLTVFDILGRKVQNLVDELQVGGYHKIEFAPSGLASGLYSYRISASSVSKPAESYTQVKKMLLIK